MVVTRSLILKNLTNRVMLVWCGVFGCAGLLSLWYVSDLSLTLVCGFCFEWTWPNFVTLSWKCQKFHAFHLVLLFRREACPRRVSIALDLAGRRKSDTRSSKTGNVHTHFATRVIFDRIWMSSYLFLVFPPSFPHLHSLGDVSAQFHAGFSSDLVIFVPNFVDFSCEYSLVRLFAENVDLGGISGEAGGRRRRAVHVEHLAAQPTRRAATRRPHRRLLHAPQGDQKMKQNWAASFFLYCSSVHGEYHL